MIYLKNKGCKMKQEFKMIATCPHKDIFIRDMIAKCFYDTPNKASYDLNDGRVIMAGKVLDGWRVVIKGKRVRLEFRVSNEGALNE